MSTRLAIKTAEITEDGILIRSMEVIDGVSGAVIKIARLTPQLLDFLKLIEIEVDDYFAVTEMKKKNSELKKLINNFKLNT